MRLLTTVRLQAYPTLLATLITFSLATGCSAPPFRGYQGPELPDDRVAILDWSGWGAPPVLEIDGKEPDLRGLIYTGHFPQDQARLLPGTHKIRYGGWFSVSVLINPKGYVIYDRTAILNMKAGHVYTVNKERLYYPLRDYLWIEDKTTGEVVHGVKPGAWQKDYELSVQQLTSSAEQGDAEAAYELALYYERRQRAAERWKWLCRAANHGHSEAMFKLGDWHRYGQSGRQNYVRAFMWYSLAASNGIRYAAKERDNLAETMTPAQVAEAKKLVADWKRGACEPKGAGFSN